MNEHLQTLVKRCDNECSWKHSAETKTCLKQDDINTIAKSLNTTNTQTAINKALPDCKGSEFCWVKQTGNMSKLGDNFKPVKMEDKKNDWLWNIDVDKALSLVAQTNSSFKAFKAVPSNFLSMDADDLWYYQSTNVRELDLQKELKKGYTSIGMVFNTSPSTRPGKHWVCMYIDISRNIAYYYDSAGKPPISQVVDFINQMPSKPKLINNKIKNQYKNIDCGMYCLYMLSGLSNGHSFDNLVQYAPNDDFINKLRKAFFLKEETNKMLIVGGSVSYPRNEYLYLRLLLKNCEQFTMEEQQIGGGSSILRYFRDIAKIIAGAGAMGVTSGAGGDSAVMMGFTISNAAKVMNELKEGYEIVKIAENLGEYAEELLPKVEEIYNQTGKVKEIFQIEDIFERADAFVNYLNLPDWILTKYCKRIDNLFDTVAETLGSLLSTVIPNDAGTVGIAIQEYLINVAKKQLNDGFIQKLDGYYQKLNEYDVPLNYSDPAGLDKASEVLKQKNTVIRKNIEDFKKAGTTSWKNMIDNRDRMAQFIRIIIDSLSYLIDSNPNFISDVANKLRSQEKMMLVLRGAMLSLVKSISPTAGVLLKILSAPSTVALKALSITKSYSPVGLMTYAASKASDAVLPTKYNPKTIINNKIKASIHNVLHKIRQLSNSIANVFSYITFIAVVLIKLMQNCLKDKTKNIDTSARGFFSRWFGWKKKKPQKSEATGKSDITEKSEATMVSNMKNAATKMTKSFNVENLQKKAKDGVSIMSRIVETGSNVTDKLQKVVNKVSNSIDNAKKVIEKGTIVADKLNKNAIKIQKSIEEVNEMVSNSALPASIKDSVGTVTDTTRKGTDVTKVMSDTAKNMQNHVEQVKKNVSKGTDMVTKIQDNVKLTKAKLEQIETSINSGKYNKIVQRKFPLEKTRATVNAARAAGGRPYIYYRA